MEARKLEVIVNSNETATELFKMLEERERNRSVTDVRQIFYQLVEKNKNVSQDDLIMTFKKLEDLGLGSIVVGRGNNPTRFQWNYSLKDIAQKAQGKDIELKPIFKPGKSANKQKSTKVVPLMKASGATIVGDKLQIVVIKGESASHYTVNEQAFNAFIAAVNAKVG